MNDLIGFFQRNRGIVLGFIVGLILCVLWFNLGFWRTTLALLIIGFSTLTGYWISKHGVAGIIRIFDKIFK
ncbi:MAG TPA: DUF2273 domain-containing protein [Clostridia bacterium]|nr:DUF2273 domain-containing protein [Clostridia bacterium]